LRRKISIIPVGRKKLIGIALIYLAPFVLKFLREKLEEYEEREVLKSLEEIL